MERRSGLKLVVASAAWMVAGLTGLIAGAPAYAHVDPNSPVAGPSVARATTVSPYGQAAGASASHSGGTLWLLAGVLVGAGLLMVAACQMWRSANRRRAAGEGGPLPDAINDALNAELRQIAAAATEVERFESALL